MASRAKLEHGGRLRRIAVAAAGILVATLTYQALTWPDVGELARQPPETTAFIDRARREARRTGSAEPNWTWVPYERISRHLKRAVLVAEDIDFHSHKGFAWGELEKAWKEHREDGKRLRGASTLSQQLVKNLWLSPSRNPWRKVKEALLTMQLERTLEKRRIFEIYLNVVQFGPEAFGAEVAARRYFGKAAAGLDASEAAALAAALPSPRRWHPEADSEVATRRRQRIRVRMAKAAWLDKIL